MRINRSRRQFRLAKSVPWVRLLARREIKRTSASECQDGFLLFTSWSYCAVEGRGADADNKNKLWRIFELHSLAKKCC
jgi:hypothetical protein